ncbi:MAG TPA: hypothetical protein VHF05_03160 [Candidatus Paceibacterota bacterium]|nr:hypothetical protein [Candidatus Paceibacterota bacterium]
MLQEPTVGSTQPHFRIRPLDDFPPRLTIEGIPHTTENTAFVKTGEGFEPLPSRTIIIKTKEKSPVTGELPTVRNPKPRLVVFIVGGMYMPESSLDLISMREGDSRMPLPLMVEPICGKTAQSLCTSEPVTEAETFLRTRYSLEYYSVESIQRLKPGDYKLVYAPPVNPQPEKVQYWLLRISPGDNPLAPK